MSRYQTSQRYVKIIMTFAAGLWLFAAAAQAQVQFGNIFGTVTAQDGSRLPGVTVTLTGIGAPQTFATTSDGGYRFLNLHPGTYNVSAELAGFSTINRNVDVTIGNNAEINVKLAPSVAETITVTAATPVIDRRQAGTGAVVEKIELENVPTARDPWVVLQSVPSVLVDRVNIGGNESGQQSYFVGKGVSRSQTEWNIDGVSVSDMATTGSSAFYYDFDSFDEMQVTTGSPDVSVRSPGVHLNMVTKRGNNEFKGSGRFFWTDKSLQATGTIPAEATSYLAAGGNSIDHIDDFGIEAGGPLMRDRLWLWGAYSGNNINNFSSGSAVVQRIRLSNWNGKLNAQFVPTNNAEAFFMWNNKVEKGRGLSPTRPPETSQDQNGPGYIAKLQDTQMFGQNLYLTGTFAKIQNKYTLTPEGGLTQDAWWDSPAVSPTNNGWHRTYRYFHQNVPQTNARIDGSKFVKTGAIDHEFKFGFGYRDTPVQSATVYAGSGNFGNFYDGYALAALTRPAIPHFGSTYYDTYLGDTVVLGNLTLTGGLRWDMQRAKNFASDVPANPVVPDLLPAVHYAGDTQYLKWNGIAPRIGATWAIGEQKKSLIRASYSKYLDQLGSSDAGSSNPFYRVQYLYYYWDDLNGDKTIQRNEIDFKSGLYSFKNIDPNNPAAGYAPGRLDYNMKPPTTNEFVLGFDREIGAGFAVGANYSYRKRTNLLWDRYEKTRGANDFYTAADYVVGGTTTGTLPDGTAYSVPWYKLKSGIPAPINYVTGNRPDYYQSYNGLELTATKRMTHGWMLRGNVTLMDWKQHVGPNAIQSPTPLVEGDSCRVCNGAQVASGNGLDGYINSKWAYSVNSAMDLPLGFKFGTAIVGRQGYIQPYYRRVNAAIDGSGNRNVMVVPEFSSNRLPDLFNVDLRLAHDFAVTSAARLNISLDLFNATNQRTVLWRDNRLFVANGADPQNNHIVDLESPRVWRLGARVSF